MEGISVIEARDVSLNDVYGTQNLDEARKKDYRQICQYQQRGWLRSEGEGRNKRYFQTERFLELEVVPRRKSEREASVKQSASDYSVLFRESNEYKGELEIELGEIDEYHSLRCRFPELKSRLESIYIGQESVNGISCKINVLNNILNGKVGLKCDCIKQEPHLVRQGSSLTSEWFLMNDFARTLSHVVSIYTLVER